MSHRKEMLSQLSGGPLALLKWTLLACAVGTVCGLAGAAFHSAVDTAAHARLSHPWLVWLLPAAGAAIPLLYRLSGMEGDGGTNLVLTAAREGRPLRLRTAPLVFLSTVLTHLTGGSSGREGAALQLGSSLSSTLGGWLGLDEKDLRTMTMCGMAGGFSALFGTPLAAAVFALEVASVGVMYYAALLPCVLSALAALLVARQLGVPPTVYVLSGVPRLQPLPLLQTVVLALAFAALAVLFCRMNHLSAKLYHRFFPDPLLRGAAGGGLVLALTCLVWLWVPGSYDYNGAGGEIIAGAIAGSVRPEAFLLKLLFTAATLGAGFKGGEIVPSFACGSALGCAAAPLLGLSPSFGAGLGMVSVFCGVTNCPMASLLLAFEVFGGTGIPFFALSIAAAYMLSGYSSLYTEQRILYSKLRPELIDKKAD